MKSAGGIQPDVTKQLMEEATFDTLQKYVAVVFDEAKIKENFVYNKHDCRIIGFIDYGDVNNSILEFERSFEGSKPDGNVAEHMLVFMVRGVFIRLKFPFAQYPTNNLSADLLYSMAWSVVRSLKCAGFKVISLTGDKASVNMKFFHMHQVDDYSSSGKAPYKIRHPYTSEKRDIYFISDVLHLIKTVRNCWSNSFGHSRKRALWVSKNKRIR